MGSQVAVDHTGVNPTEVIHRSSDLFPTVDAPVDNSVDNRGGGLTRVRTVPTRAHRLAGSRGHFHWVETTNPPAMKPKPTTMFQLPSASIGRLPVVT